jgi:hypothetical protein
MTQANSLIVGAAALTLTLGVTRGNVPAEVQEPLSNSDIVIVDNDAAAIGQTDNAAAIGQTDNTAEQSAEMSKATGIHNGEHQGETPTRNAYQ